MSTLYIHAGPKKTASTFIQSLLTSALSQDPETRIKVATTSQGFTNCSSIAPFLEPQSPAFINVAHAPDEAEAVLQRIVDDLETHDVILSGELLGNLSVIGYQKLTALAAGHNMNVLFVARQYEARALSHWQEDLKWGGTISFSDFVERLKTEGTSEGLSFSLASKYRVASEGVGQAGKVFLSCLGCRRRTPREVFTTLSNWTNRRLSAASESNIDRNEGVLFYDAVSLAILNHVVNAAFKYPRLSSPQTRITAAFAREMRNNRKGVEEYFLYRLDDAIGALDQLKVDEWRELRAQKALTIESPSTFYRSLRESREDEIRNYFEPQ
jgi:hypothetical protein